MENDSKNIKIRPADIQDSSIILYLIKELGKFEKFSEEDMPVTIDQVKDIFSHKYIEILIAETNNLPVGLCSFYHNFNLKLGNPGIIIEDFFILSEYRRLGVGIALFKELSKIAIERDCSQIEGSVLSWNKPALSFYKKLGGIEVKNPIEFALNEENIEELAKKPLN